MDMPNTAEIIRAVESLPVEERAHIVETILKSLNAPNLENDRIWAVEAAHRLDEIRSGRVEAEPGEEVFARARRRFER